MSGRRRAERRGPGRRTIAVVVLLTLTGVLLLASLPLFVFPAVDSPAALRSEPVDAVLVLGGGPGDRMGTAIELIAMLPEPPPTLLVSIQYGAPLVTCGTAPGLPRVPTRCFEPEPFTTAGEALELGRLAAAEGWERVVVVTSDFHVTRARRLVRACMAALSPATEVLWAAASTDALSLHGGFAVATEWPSLLGTGFDHEPACRSEG